MNIIPIKTHKITVDNKDIFKILDKYIKNLEEGSIVSVTSKIVAITEGRVALLNRDKDKLIEEEAEYFLPRSSNKYNVSLTITRGMLAASAGIDESNANGTYVLWPENPQKSAENIWNYLRKKFDIKNLGVIITDSKTTPMRWGVTAISIGYCGIKPIKDYIGAEDLFGRIFEFEKMNIIDNLASACALVMGEGKEQTPLSVVTDVSFIEFVDHSPSKEELKSLQIVKEDDLYAPLLESVAWEKGKK